MTGMNLGTVVSLDLTSTLMAKVDENAPKPEPVPGESGVDYWLRVVQFQAWERGRVTGLTDARPTRSRDMHTDNPYAEVHRG